MEKSKLKVKPSKRLLNEYLKARVETRLNSSAGATPETSTRAAAYEALQQHLQSIGATVALAALAAADKDDAAGTDLNRLEAAVAVLRC